VNGCRCIEQIPQGLCNVLGFALKELPDFFLYLHVAEKMSYEPKPLCKTTFCIPFVSILASILVTGS
jgi:hypothetical protein